MANQVNNDVAEQSIGDMFQQATDNDMVDSLLGQADEPEQQEPAQQQRQAPAPKVNGFEPLIRAKRTKISELSKRLRSFDSENSPYVTTNASGEQAYNHAMFQREQLDLTELREELRELERKRDESERTGQQNSEVARRLARALLDREVAKLPKNLHQPVVKLFGQYFTHLEGKGEWGQARYAEPAALRDALVEVLDNVIGKITRQNLTAPASAGVSQGSADEDDLPQAQGDHGESEEVDDFTNNTLYAYEQRRTNRGKSIGQIRREEREAARNPKAKGGER